MSANVEIAALKIEIAALKEYVRGGFESIARRMDEAQTLSKDRHQENVARLTSIDAEAKKTNGRITSLEIEKAASDKADKNNLFPSLKVWLIIVSGTLTAAWFVGTVLLGFHRG